MVWGQNRDEAPERSAESGPWRIREIVPDLVLEDVWALPVQGSADDFETLLALLVASDPAEAESGAARFLWRLRDRLGDWFDLGRIAPANGGDAGGRLPIPGHAGDLAGRPASRRSARHRDRPGVRLAALRAALPHRHRVRRGDLEPDRPRGDAPCLGRPGRRALAGADGRLREAPRPLRQGVHGSDQTLPLPDRLPGTDATD